MSLAKSVKRWTVRTLRTMVLVSALGAPVAAGWAQAPAAGQAALPKKTYTKTGVFDLPVQMHESLRGNLQEVRLYVKTATTGWVLKESGPASLTRFTYRVPEDGEYWFSLATVDRQGKQTPDDVNQEPPCLRVVVDRQAPMLQVQPWTSTDGEVCVRCAVQDANFEPAALRAVAKTAQGEVNLEPMPGQPGAFRLRGSESASLVRITATDLAGNVATREMNPRELPTAAPGTTTTVSARPDSRPYASPLPKGDPVAAPAPLPAMPNVAAVPAPPPAIINGTEAPPVAKSPAPMPGPATPVAHTQAPAELSAPGPVAPLTATTPAPTDATVRRDLPSNRQLLNTTRASVDYRIDQVGPSGIGKVEVYVTADQGQSWQRLREYTDRRTPAEVELPGEGIFGIRLVITNGNGFGGRAPQRGDTPDCWIEVDTTGPFVQLRPIEVVAQSGTLDIHWTASDKNLSAEPVSLFYRTRPDAPWQVVARNVKNDGTYRWPFPRDAGSNFYFKVEVTDQAGNAARVESPTPTVLDMTEPRASVVSVSGSASRPTAPNGN